MSTEEIRGWGSLRVPGHLPVHPSPSHADLFKQENLMQGQSVGCENQRPPGLLRYEKLALSSFLSLLEGDHARESRCPALLS